MKIFRNIFVILAVIVLAAYGSFFLFVKFKGRAFLLGCLKDVFHQPVVMGRVVPQLPLGVTIYDFSLPGQAPVKEIDIQLKWIDPFNHRFRLRRVRLDAPNFYLKRSSDGTIGLNASAPSTEPSVSHNPATAGGTDEKAVNDGIWPVAVDHFIVTNGAVIFEDASFEPFNQMQFNNIELTLKNLGWPLESKNLDITLKALLIKDDMLLTESEVIFKGWLNWPRRNMDGQLNISNPKDKVVLTADVRSRNNLMQVQGKMMLNRLTENMPRGSASLENFLVDALRAADFDITTHFDFSTPMDAFSMDKISFQGEVIHHNSKPENEARL
jgi:hypothetical protein